MTRCKCCDRLLEDFPIDDTYEFCNKCYSEVLDDLTDIKEFRGFSNVNKKKKED